MTNMAEALLKAGFEVKENSVSKEKKQGSSKQSKKTQQAATPMWKQEYMIHKTFSEDDRIEISTGIVNRYGKIFAYGKTKNVREIKRCRYLIDTFEEKFGEAFTIPGIKDLVISYASVKMGKIVITDCNAFVSDLNKFIDESLDHFQVEHMKSLSIKDLTNWDLETVKEAKERKEREEQEEEELRKQYGFLAQQIRMNFDRYEPLQSINEEALGLSFRPRRNVNGWGVPRFFHLDKSIATYYDNEVRIRTALGKKIAANKAPNTIVNKWRLVIYVNKYCEVPIPERLISEEVKTQIFYATKGAITEYKQLFPNNNLFDAITKDVKQLVFPVPECVYGSEEACNAGEVFL